MKPVTIFELPHNFRDRLYAPGEAPDAFCDDPELATLYPYGHDFVDLPIPMPTCLFALTDRDGRVIAIPADGKRIRWADLDILLAGVEQYNADLARQGIRHEPHAQIDDLPDAMC